MELTVEEEGDQRTRQLFAAHRRLWSAVMWQALSDAVLFVNATKKFHVSCQEDALEWFTSGDTHVGSFIWICESVLGLDPDRVRERTRALVRAALSKEVTLERRRGIPADILEMIA
jgi:hypothetical protein